MKLIKYTFFVVLFIVFSCSDSVNEQSDETITQREPIKLTELKQKIDARINETGRFYWKDFSTYELWSAIVQSNKLVSIGFGNSAQNYNRQTTTNQAQIQNDLLDIIARYEGKSKGEVLVYSDQQLNLFDVIIEKQETLAALKRNRNIRYIEPADFKYYSIDEEQPNDGSEYTIMSSSSSSGCGYESSTLNTADFTTVTPNARVPWNFYIHNIPNAWSSATGSGITIGIIDTGISPQQSLLGTSFNTGASSGRFVQRFGTFVDSFWPWSTTTDGPNDLCGHGTSMAAVATAPRNNNGLPVGVAYNANLVSYRAASNVVLDGYHEQRGVQNAFVALGNRSDVRIISMSMGHIFSSGRIEDGVRFAHSRGKLIFCAGGTSTSFTTFVGVIFPAWMPEVQAVTGLKEGTTFQKCDVCHTGNEIDFTVVMQKASSGNTIPVLSYYNLQSDYVGGSSVATATTAGIAALVWSKYPNWSREQVLNRLAQSSTFFPNKNSQFGFGNINATLAVQ